MPDSGNATSRLTARVAGALTRRGLLLTTTESCTGGNALRAGDSGRRAIQPSRPG